MIARTVLVLALVVASRPADACVPAFVRGIVGAPAFEPAGAVAVTGEDVTVTCTERHDCTVESRFRIAVTTPATVTVKLTAATVATLAATATATLAPAEAHVTVPISIALVPSDSQLVMRATLALPDYVDGCYTSGVIARHHYLASEPAGDRRILELETTTVPKVVIPDSWSMEMDPRAARGTSPGGVLLWFDVPGRVLTHGGPILMVGASSAGRTFHARAAWEVAVGRPWLVISLAGETDFDEVWNVALVAEPTTSAWVLPLSFGAGLGAVVEKEPGFDPRLGMRAQLSIALGRGRVTLSVDGLVGGDGGIAFSGAVMLGYGL